MAITINNEAIAHNNRLTCARNVRSLKVGPVIAIEAGALWTVCLHTVTVGRTGHTGRHSRGQLLNVGAQGTPTTLGGWIGQLSYTRLQLGDLICVCEVLHVFVYTCR